TREQVSMAVRMQAIDRLDLWAAAFEAGRGLNAEALAVARGADRQALDIANPPEEKWIQFEKNPAAKREQAAASMTKMLVALVERAPALKDDPTVQQAFAAAMHLHANSLLEVTQAMEASHAPAAVVAGLKQEQGLLLVQPGGVNENLAQAVANGVLAATERLRADKTFSDAQAFTLIGWATTRAEQAQTPDAAKYRAAITGFFAQVNEQATGNGARAM
ncbi:MAG: hypothetical protein J0L97_07890, partial [Alphaproteobacteria bacterium]|nr:hypothetical protein [Alphaproteobacteria bacterium]